jgi:hypothetical protein
MRQRRPAVPGSGKLRNGSPGWQKNFLLTHSKLTDRMKTISVSLGKTLLAAVLLTGQTWVLTAQSSGTTFTNVAPGKQATASSNSGVTHAASYAFDASLSTWYQSDFNEAQWLQVDLGKPYLLNSIIINWEKSYASDFDILFSNTGTFTDMVSDSIRYRNHFFKSNANPNSDTIKLKTNKVARYLKLVGYHSATGNGYGIREIQVMGTTSSTGLFPVSVTAFNAEQISINNQLSWTTVTEFNNAGFAVERSADAANFTSIGWLAANNGGTVANNYSFTDKQALPGKNYYRLRQFWLDGKTGYSAVIMLNNATSNSGVSVYPMPAKDHLTIEYRGNAGENVFIVLLTNAGVPVYSGRMTMQGNSQSFIMNRTGNMRAGEYFLSIQGGSKQYNQKVLLD